MKFVSPFETNFWAQGPWAFFNMGLQFMQTWQEECFSRLRLMPVFPLTTLAPRPAVSLQSEARKSVAASEIKALTDAVAVRQGRETPMLGCLQNVQVVGGPVPDVAPVAKKELAPKEAKTTVKATEKSSVKPAVKAVAKSAAKPKVVSAPAPVQSEQRVADASPAQEVEEVVPTSTPSVTSMLAMQAKSLAKAVKTAPPPVAAKASAKPASKSAAKPVAPVQKAPVKAKPATSKKA